MSNSVNKSFSKNHNTISNISNTNFSLLNAKLSENKYTSDKLKATCLELSSIINRLKFLHKYISNVYVHNKKKKIRSIYHLFKEKRDTDEMSFARIRKYVENNSDNQLYDLRSYTWDAIAEQTKIPKNTCYSLWSNYNCVGQQLKPEDDMKILKYHKNFEDWIEFSIYIQKPAFAIFKQYIQLKQQNRRDLWTVSEDIMLNEAVYQFGVGKWTLIAYYVSTKGPKQCMHRYRNKFIEGIQTGKWEADEDERLMDAISIYKAGKWSRISEHVGTRNDSQCRERYCNILDPNLKKTRWTPDEDYRLTYAISKYGEGNWSRVSTEIKGRTDAQCRRRFTYLRKIK